jgi:prepilin signal peptidase PulO-like enzyme (type II secretory pathway)
MVSKPSVPRIEPPPIRSRTPAFYWYGFLGSAGWSIGVPALYAVIEPSIPIKTGAVYWLSHAAAIVWIFSLMALVVFLGLLAEYSPPVKCLCDVLVWVIEILSYFMPF